MKTLLIANLSTKTASATDGNAWQPPPFVFGESVTLALRFVEDRGGVTVPADYEIDSMKAAIGALDARPREKSWALKIGADPQSEDNTTAALGHDCTAKQLENAINALTAIAALYGEAVVSKDDGSWRIVFGGGADEVTLAVVDNTLLPVCSGRISRYEIDDVWHHEVRLVQAPVAFTDAGELVLPDPPEVTRVRAGETSGDFLWNEIQALYVPPDFRATFMLRSGAVARSGQLSIGDTAESLQTAINSMLSDEEAVTVTNVAFQLFHIEWTGRDFEGQGQTLLTVEALNPPPGDLTFTIDLSRAELAAALARAAEVTLPLEVRIWTVGADDVVTPRVAFRQDVTIQRPVIWPDLALVPGVDWLRPLSPKNYQAFNPETVITGQQYYPEVVGDGAATEFAIAHGLATEVVFVFVRENVAGGAQLVQGTDFSVTIDSADEVTVTAIGGAPGADAWLIVVMSAQTVAAFAAGLEIEIDQVTGLEDRLAAIEADLAELMSLIGGGSVIVRSEVAAGAIEIVLPTRREAFPGRFATVPNPADTTNLPRAGRLVPAIHDASADVLAALPLDAASDHEGELWQNTTGDTILLPIRLGPKKPEVADDGYFGSDGRIWYRLTQRGTTKSYFPTDLERELWAIYVNERQLRVKRRLLVEAELTLQMLVATSRMQCRLVIEIGEAPSQSTPVGSAIDITGAGTGTHTLTKDGETIGTFTVNAGTDVITLAAHGLADDDVVRMTNSGGALPGGLAAATDYVVRDKTTDTFKVALLQTATNLKDVEWNATPLLDQRIVIMDTAQVHKYGCQIARTAADEIEALARLYEASEAGGVAPASANFALRARLIDFDTENSITGAKGLVFYESTGVAGIDKL